MPSQLRLVLDRFTSQAAPVSLHQMARELDLTPGMLADMIGYWVRKGKLREVSVGGAACTACGVRTACPFVVALPRYYEVVRPDDTHDPDAPACACGGACAS